MGVIDFVPEIELVENYPEFEKIGVGNSSWSTVVYMYIYRTLNLNRTLTSLEAISHGNKTSAGMCRIQKSNNKKNRPFLSYLVPLFQNDPSF